MSRAIRSSKRRVANCAPFSWTSIAETDEDIPISARKVHRRKAGEALSPAREPIAVEEL
jgi:hypothetical protein